jgi:hypothetical protein
MSKSKEVSTLPTHKPGIVPQMLPEVETTSEVKTTPEPVKELAPKPVVRTRPGSTTINGESIKTTEVYKQAVERIGTWVNFFPNSRHGFGDSSHIAKVKSIFVDKRVNKGFYRMYDETGKLFHTAITKEVW